jgi:hypothetical protein
LHRNNRATARCHIPFEALDHSLIMTGAPMPRCREARWGYRPRKTPSHLQDRQYPTRSPSKIGHHASLCGFESSLPVFLFLFGSTTSSLVTYLTPLHSHSFPPTRPRPPRSLRLKPCVAASLPYSATSHRTVTSSRPQRMTVSTCWIMDQSVLITADTNYLAAFHAR